MTGYVYGSDGSKTALPELLEWRLVRTDGIPADGFSVSFRFEAKWEAILKKAIRFEGVYGGESRFFGIVDEYEVRYDGEGLVVHMNGRGLAGLLMDNQVGQRELYWVSLADILGYYVKPYGITKIQYEQNYRLNTFAVEYGESAWQALYGFCQWAAEITPRFLGDGTLQIGQGSGKQIQMGQPERVEEAVFRGCRYGVYSQVVARNMATGLESTVTNQLFQNLGGCATRRVTIPRKNTCRAGNSSPGTVLRESAKGWRTLRLRLGGTLFAAEPGDTVSLELPKLGIAGTFRVTESENCLDTGGRSCTLSMYAYE
ncbi:MAG: hypothetical protein PUC06_05465 [Oscillospiraceae bacterium]|nr:hypothetical protein [Oscillospiraceae bacterium]